MATWLKVLLLARTGVFLGCLISYLTILVLFPPDPIIEAPRPRSSIKLTLPAVFQHYARRGPPRELSEAIGRWDLDGLRSLPRVVGLKPGARPPCPNIKHFSYDGHFVGLRCASRHKHGGYQACKVDVLERALWKGQHRGFHQFFYVYSVETPAIWRQGTLGFHEPLTGFVELGSWLGDCFEHSKSGRVYVKCEGLPMDGF